MRFLKLAFLSVATFTIATAQTKSAGNIAPIPAARAVAARDAAAGLTSGTALTFPLPAIPSNAQNQGTIYTGDSGNTITVPAGATSLQVMLNTTPSNTDVDLYLRKDQPVGMNGSVPVADYVSQGPAGNEVISIKNPAAGVYYVGYGLFTFNQASSVTVTATVTAPSGCTYTLGPGTGATVGNTGTTTASFGLTTQLGCNYSVTSDVPWLRATNAGGSGSGAVTYVADLNTGAQRGGHLTINGQTYTITQGGTTGTPLPDNALILPQVVAGGTQWNTTFVVTNLSGNSEGFTLRFYDEAGVALQLPVTGSGTVSSLDGTLAAGETRRIELGSGGTQMVAWAALIPTTPGTNRFSGFAIEHEQLSQTSAAEATVPFGNILTSKQVLYYDEAAPYSTAFALVNPDPTSSLTINVDIRSDLGAAMGTDTIVLPASGHAVYFVAQRFPSTAGKRGTLRFSSSPKGFVGMGLRFSSAGGPFTSIPFLTSSDIQ